MAITYLSGGRIQGTTAIAIVKDAQATNSEASSGTTVTISSFTVANNSNRILIVTANIYAGSEVVTGITWNGNEALARAVFNNDVDGSSPQRRSEIWYLVNPTATTASVVATWASAAIRRALGVYSFYNAAQTSPIGVTNTANADASPSTGTLTPTTAGSLIVDTEISEGGNVAATDTLTAGWTNLVSTRTYSSQYNLSPTIGASNNMFYTYSGARPFTWCAAEVKANQAVDDRTTLVTAADTATRQTYRVDDEEYVTVSAPNLNFTVPTGDAESSSFGGDTLTFDIGSALSDTAWVARLEMTFTASSNNSNWQAMNGVALWVSDTADGNLEDAQDCRTIVAYQSQNNVVKFGINARNNATPEQSFTDGNAILSSLSSTTYYVQFSYANDVGTMSITTNSDYTTGTSTGTKDVSGITGLRYLKITGFTEYRSGQYTNGSVIGNFQNIKICDTTSTFSTGAITYEPELSATSNLPVGTRFEETNTRKIYRMKDGDWVEKGTA